MARTPTSEPLAPLIIRKVFKGLQLYYPGFYRGLDEKHTEAARRAWAEQLFKFSDEKILEALRHCPDVYLDRAPNVGQFKALCRQRPEHEYAEPLKLEMLKSSDAVGKEAIDGLRRIVGRVSVEKDPPEMTEEQIASRKSELREQVRQHEEGQAS